MTSDEREDEFTWRRLTTTGSIRRKRSAGTDGEVPILEREVEIHRRGSDRQVKARRVRFTAVTTPSYLVDVGLLSSVAAALISARSRQFHRT